MGDKEVYLHVFSLVDKSAWAKISPVVSTDESRNIINIALYHGAISGSELDNSWHMEVGEEEIVRFSDFDFVLMGDIHKQQYLNYRTVDLVLTEEELAKQIELYGETAILEIEECE
jgi:hypothetical protein